MTFESSSLILPEHVVSGMAESLIGSEIIKIAAEVNEKIKKATKYIT